MRTTLMFLLLAIIATGVLAYIVIYRHKRRQAQSPKKLRGEVDEAQRKIEDESRGEEEVLRKREEQPKRSEEEEERRHAEKECERLEEEVCKGAEEAQRGVKEEARRKAEELRKVEEEQTHRKAKKAQQKAGEEEPLKAKAEGKELEPDKRGGRPRVSTQDPEKQGMQETKQRRSKPEIVCWKRERQWILGIEVPEELLGNSGLVVLQNASPLTQDEYREGCWHLEQAFGEAVVQWNEDDDAREAKIPLSEENYLLFKLTGQSQSQGRRVKSPSSGSYLVVVPEAWERDEALSGFPRVAPEPVSLAGYKAHFFDLEKDSDIKIAFRTPANESFVIESRASRFELVGTRLNDANQDMGPLFGERPPNIRTVGDQAWADIDCIVVLEEGKRAEEKQWRDVIAPAEKAVEVRLGDKLEERRAGWCSLRIYDKQLGPPVESLDFRFICALKEIRMLQPFPLPSEDGHRPVCVEFLHEPGCAIQPTDDPASNAQIEHADDKTILSIPPDPACDKTRWLVGPRGGPSVEVTILVERIWWVVAKEDEAPSEWKDTRFTLSRGDFAATSNKAIWVRVPRPRWVDVLSVGFEQSKSRPYTLKVTEETVAVPLRDFGDSQEVADRTCEHLLNVWIKRDDGLVQGVIAIVPAEQPTTPVVDEDRAERPLLNLAVISASRLASVLTGLRRATRGPLRLLIKRVRHEYRKGCIHLGSETENFVKKALCMIAFALELNGEKQSQILAVKKHWVVKARLARDESPEIMSQLQNRYENLQTGGAYRASGMPDRR